MLLAVVLPFVVRGINQSASSAAAYDRRATAMMLAESKLAQAVLAEAWDLGQAEGTFEQADGDGAERFTWALTVADWQSTDYRELTMTVSWESGRGEQSVQLKTVVYAGA